MIKLQNNNKRNKKKKQKVVKELDIEVLQKELVKSQKKRKFNNRNKYKK